MTNLEPLWRRMAGEIMNLFPRFSEEYPREWWERMKRNFFGPRIHESDVYASVAACTNCGLIHSGDDVDCPSTKDTNVSIGALLDEAITAMENWKFIGFGTRAEIIKRLKEARAGISDLMI